MNKVSRCKDQDSISKHIFFNKMKEKWREGRLLSSRLLFRRTTTLPIASLTEQANSLWWLKKLDYHLCLLREDAISERLCIIMTDGRWPWALFIRPEKPSVTASHGCALGHFHAHWAVKCRLLLHIFSCQWICRTFLLRAENVVLAPLAFLELKGSLMICRMLSTGEGQPHWSQHHAEHQRHLQLVLRGGKSTPFQRRVCRGGGAGVAQFASL